MPPSDQVFISYNTKADRDFARELARDLRAAAFDAWLDEERIPAGANFRVELSNALRDCKHAIFVVSAGSLEGDWTWWELDTFTALDSKRSRIAILRVNRGELLLPPQLSQLHNIEWPSDGRDRFAQMWLVVCGLKHQHPGPAADWVASGAQLLGKHADVKDAPAVADRPHQPSSGRVAGDVHLLCDRSAQWGEFASCASTREHQAFVLVGAEGEAHDHFSQRIARFLPRDPQRRVVSVSWTAGRCPRRSADLVSELARALEVAEKALVQKLGELLQHQNVVVLQPTAQSFGHDALHGYLVHVLPSYVQSLGQTRFGLKLVQPIEVAARRAGWREALKSLLIGAQQDVANDSAGAFIARVQDDCSPLLPVIPLPALSPITTQDVENFCAQQNIPIAQRRTFVEQVQKNARSSVDVLRNIEAQLPIAELT